MDFDFSHLWALVSGCQDDLVGLEPSEEVVHELNQVITSIADIGWELGPVDGGGAFLAFSPGRDIELMPLLRKLVASAPQIDGLEFLIGRPARVWNFVVSVRTEHEGTLAIDCSEWLYALEVFEDGRVGIEIASGANEVRGWDPASVSRLAVDMTLGEDFRLESLEYLDCVEELPADRRENATALKYLAEHLASIGLK
jgi:hypothetical protein